MKFVSATLQATNVETGLDQFEFADGATVATNVAGSDCRAAAPNPTGGRYIYFRIDDSFKWAPSMQAEVDVEYFDSSGGSFAVEFDGSDTNAPFNGAYTRSSTTVYLNGNQLWRTARFNLSGAHFMNSQNGGADFRLAVSADAFFVRRVKVIRPGVPDEAGQVLNGYQDNFADALSANWVAIGAVSNQFQSTNGVLRIHSASNDFRQLLLMLPGASGATQELLARARVTRLAAGDALPGGVAVVTRTIHRGSITSSAPPRQPDDKWRCAKHRWVGVHRPPSPGQPTSGTGCACGTLPTVCRVCLMSGRRPGAPTDSRPNRPVAPVMGLLSRPAVARGFSRIRSGRRQRRQ